MAASAFQRIKIGILALIALAAVVAGAGYLVWRSNPDVRLYFGEKAYASGVQALERKDGPAAVKHFDEAVIHAQNTMELLNRKLQGITKESPDFKKYDDMAARVFLLKAYAVRDLSHAQALSEGKPFADFPDQSTGESYRSLTNIKDFAAMNEAVGNLREAARRLPADVEVQKMSLRTELTQRFWDWNEIREISRRLIEINPKDARAQYLMARHEFEQHQKVGDVYEATAPGKRVAGRVKRAREHLAKSKDSGKYPLWRTLFLEAQIAQWLALDAERTESTALKEREEQTLQALLFDTRTGAMQRARDGDEIEQTMNALDQAGLLGLQKMALDESFKNRRAFDASQTAKAMGVMNGILAVAEKLTQGNPGRLADVAEHVVACASVMQPIWIDRPNAEAKAQKTKVEALVRQCRESKIARPAVYHGFAIQLMREAHVERKRGNPEASKLQSLAEQCLADGISIGHEAKLTDAALAELHIVAAETKLLRGRREDIASHLEALRRIPAVRNRNFAASADLIEGILFEREGRFDKARESLEKAAASNNPQMMVRANLILAGVYLATGQADSAITSLEYVEKQYAILESFTPEERAWFLEFVQQPSQVKGYLAVAHLTAAGAKLGTYLKQNPDKPIPYETVRNHENAAGALLLQVKPPDPVNLYVRQQFVGYLANTRRAELADAAVAALEKDYPDKLEVLRLAVGTMTRKATTTPDNKRRELDAAARTEIDSKIKQFLARFGDANQTARLFWAEWLMRTGRGTEAMAYMNNPVNFPGEKSMEFKRLLAAAQFSAGNREAALSVLENMPQNPLHDLVAIQIMTDKDEQAKKLGQAITRYENNGVFRCWDAKSDFNAGRFTEAAEKYFATMEFTRVKQLASDGLMRSLMAIAHQDPGKAKEMISLMSKTRPNEPALLLAAAYAHLRIEEIGSPNDVYAQNRTMAGALNEWQKAFLKDGGEDAAVTVGLTKARFYTLANQNDAARNELQRVLQIKPKNLAALALLAGLIVDSQIPTQLDSAEQLVNTLLAESPNHVQGHHLLAVIHETRGKPENAIAILEKLLAKDEKQSGAWARITSSYLRKGDQAKALETVRKWRKALPEDAFAVSHEIHLLATSGQMAEAKRIADALLTDAVKTAKARAAAKPPAGVDLAQWEKQQKALVENTENNVRLAVARGFGRAKAWEEVDNWIQPILTRDANHEGALVMMADTLLARKKNAEAKAMYERIAKSNPRNGPVANNLAWLLAESGDPARAYEIVQETRLNPFTKKPVPAERLDPSFLDTIGFIYTKLNRPELFAEMRETFDAAVRRYKSDARLHFYLGEAHAGLRDNDRAEAAFMAAAKLVAPGGESNLPPDGRKEIAKKIEDARARMKGTTPR